MAKELIMHSFVVVIIISLVSMVYGDVTRAEILDRSSVVLANSNVNAQRFYPFGLESAHILGYTQLNNSVKVGLEKQYNDMLLEGIPLKTTIDIQLQKYLYEIFDSYSGAVIIMNANNGEILAAGSFPSYDANIFIEGMRRKEYYKLLHKRSFTNKLINALYPPGSTMQPALGLVYLTHGIDVHASVNCTSSLLIGRRVFSCFKSGGHGVTGIDKAIRENCNDYFYKGSLHIGIKNMSDTLKRYGLGKKTGVDLPNEFRGLVPSSEWKKEKYNKPWYVGETLNTSIGQGDFLVTPLQIAKLTTLMATGKSVIPHFNRSFNTFVPDVLTQNELDKLPIIQNAMYEVCNHPQGSLSQYLSSNIEIAGQLGVAQVVASKNRELNRSHTWLTTYGPYKKPQYVVTLLLEHEGNNILATAEIVSKIYNKLLELGYVK